VRRLRVNRKPLRNWPSLAQPSRARNRVYSLSGHPFALKKLPHFFRFWRRGRTVQQCLNAATECWSLHLMQFPMPCRFSVPLHGIPNSISTLPTAVSGEPNRDMTRSSE
jgi:hypothetical protein